MKVSGIQQHLFVAAILFFFFVVHSSSSSDLSNQLERGLRGLKSFKEKPSDASNSTFDCSPSGPCVPCLYSEKKHDIYRCSETGYRIPIKCLKISLVVDDQQNHKKHNTLENTNRHLLEQDSSSSSSNVDVGSVVYVTYRSCITAVNQEKLSVLGFEALMLLLLLTSSFVIFRRKGTLIMPGGAVRVPTNPRSDIVLLCRQKIYDAVTSVQLSISSGVIK